MDETDDIKGKDPAGTQTKSAEGSVMDNLLESGLVKPAEFKSKSGGKNKSLSNEEKAKMLAMVKDLDKYNDYKNNVPLEKEKSPLAKNSGGNLFAYVNSELACLHEGEKNATSSGAGKTEKKDHKPAPSIASVSAEQQMQFESLLKGDIVKVASDEQDMGAIKSKDTVSEGRQVAKEYQDEQDTSQKAARVKEPKVLKESPKKKKDKQESKSSGKKNGKFFVLCLKWESCTVYN